MGHGKVEALDGLSEVAPEKCSWANGRGVGGMGLGWWSTDFAYVRMCCDRYGLWVRQRLRAGEKVLRQSSQRGCCSEGKISSWSRGVPKGSTRLLASQLILALFFKATRCCSLASQTTDQGFIRFGSPTLEVHVHYVSQTVPSYTPTCRPNRARPLLGETFRPTFLSAMGQHLGPAGPNFIFYAQ